MKDEWPPANIARLAREILGYLMEHPDAKDTLEGIAQWWLPNVAAAEEIERALRFLIDRGLMFERRVGSSGIYGAASRRKHELLALARALGQMQ